jgi:sugar lactone lactonase YvrE
MRPTLAVPLLLYCAASLALTGCFSDQSGDCQANRLPGCGIPEDDVADGSSDASLPDATAAETGTTDAPDGAPVDAGSDITALDSAASDASPMDAAPEAEASTADACGSCNGTCAAGRCIETLSAGVGNVTGLAVDATSVYWCTGGGSILKAPLTGVPDGGAPTVLATGINFPNAVAVDANAVYVADYSDGTVLSLPLAGVPDGGAPAILVSGLSEPAGLAVDGTTLYITSDDDTVRTAPVGGGVATLFANDPAQPNGAWLFGGNLYWIDLTGGAIKVAPSTGIPDGGLATTLLTVGGTPHHVAADATSIYWLDGTDGIIESAPVTGLPDGGVPTPIASGQNEPDGLAVDGAWVYWGDYGGTGAVYRASK